MCACVPTVPPSLPVCQWEGVVELGGRVTLSCSVTGGHPVPELQWQKMEPERLTLPINMDGKDQCLKGLGAHRETSDVAIL